MELVLEVHETLGGGILSHLERIQERWNQLNQEGQEGIGDPMGMFMFVLSLVLCIVFFVYANYILVKCYCNHFGHYFFASMVMYTVPYIMIPYLYYQRFSENGSCKKFPCN